MKNKTPVGKTLMLIFLVSLVLIFTVPGLCVDVKDKILLSGIELVLCLLFVFGTRKILNANDISQSRFNALYFGTMGMRMVLSLILIIIYLYFNSIPNKYGTIFLICTYFVYMGFEIRFILPKLRTDSEKSKNTDDARK